MKYVGGWNANNGSTYSYGYQSNNKNQLAKDMKEMCKGNVFKGNFGRWYVALNNDNDSDQNIMQGTAKY
jgi:hypothetical protein